MPEIPVLRPLGSLLVFGGPYSNIEATQAMLADADRLGFTADNILCTGDVVAYGADAAAAVRLIRAGIRHVVKGNGEEILGAGGADFGSGFLADKASERRSTAWLRHANAELGNEDRAWMAGLPRRIDVELGGKRLAVVHGSVSRTNRFVFASTAARSKLHEIETAGVDGVIGGHCGLPFTQVIDGRLWHNAGAIGMPANDGTPRVWFSILRATGAGLSIAHRSLHYDHSTAAAKMRRVGLPEDYADALSTGLWPSCDVLPLDEVRRRGASLTEGVVHWQFDDQKPVQGVRKRTLHNVLLWPGPIAPSQTPLPPEKFKDSFVTAKGERRASVALRQLDTLWFNTGTLCNITCRNCYIESSPRNDRLSYLRRDDAAGFLDEIENDGLDTREIGFTGGEPFMNPDMIDMLEDSLARGFKALVLTNAMRPMQRMKQRLAALNARYPQALTMRVSLDHFTPARHEDERGPGTFDATVKGLIWLAENGFQVAVAGRTMWDEDLNRERAGYARFFADHAIAVDAFDPFQLVLFPEMDPLVDVPEITTACWTILGKSPADVMCASSRMVVKRKGSDRPVVLACTLLPYDERFELGPTLAEAAVRPVQLNHPHCAKFCVLGGASCSAGSVAAPGDAPPHRSVGNADDAVHGRSAHVDAGR